MRRDVFYYGNKPNVHPKEKFATSLEDARQQCTTEHFWIINEFCDYQKFDWNFDFEFLPDEDVWAEEHNNVWPSQHQKDSGTWLCPSRFSDVIVYRADIDVVKYKNIKNDNWVLLDLIDEIKFDFSWHPDPTDSPYIYTWGCKFFPVELQSCLEYHAPNATNIKYMREIIELLPQTERWVEIQEIDKTKFDMSWRPNPLDPPMNYVWGNKHIDGKLKSTLEYHMPSATDTKYMPDLISVLPQWDRWKEIQPIDKSKFDLTWRPDPREPAYIYVWGNKHIPAELKSTIEYHCSNATEKKYMAELVEVLPELTRWKEYQAIDNTKFDLSWRPDPREPAYIYVWGNKHISAELKSTIEYYTPGAIEKKYMAELVDVVPELDRWKEVQSIDKTKFDLSWRPDPREPAYIYVWGNKHISAELKSTIEYYTPGAIEKKYMAELVDVVPELDRWKEVQSIDKTKFDLTWRPDPREPDYIYVWGNKYIASELKSTIEYHCPNATEYKHMGELEVAPEWDRYQILIPVDKTSFDFRWRPDPKEPDYIYVWGNEYNNAVKEPTIEYHCPGATERKYMNDRVAKTLPVVENWKIIIPVQDFDFSWRPDPDGPPYIYVFGNQWHDAMTELTLEYHVDSATDKKFVTDIVPIVAKTQENWKTLIPVASFDYSWRPNPHSMPYIYVFGNQWHNGITEPTVEYHTPGATDRKYITEHIALVKATTTEKYWNRLIPIEAFDYSWRPDPNSPPYIYVFGNKWNDAATEPSIEYHVDGATDFKYIHEPVAVTKAEIQYWAISNNDDLESFDFSWRPNPHSPPQIYQWADNGPRYTVPDATDVVYMKRNEVTKKTIVNRYKIKTTIEDLINEHSEEVFWAINPDLNYDKFDFSWRPTEENFRHINVFGNEYSKNTQTYYINGPMYMLGHKEYNYVEDQTVEIDSNLSMFFIDRSNTESTTRFNELKEKYPQLQKTRYLNSWIETINRCITKSETTLFWVLNSELDYTNFEFDFYPSPWQIKMIHVFGTQWSHWGTTYMINKETFAEDTKYIKIIEHLSNLNFIKQRRATATNILYDIIYIDHGNLSSEIESKLIIKYEESYLNTFKKMLELLPIKKEHYVWVVSTICDYFDFDFTYICDPFAKDQLHVFPSDRQKFGDTFLINVNKLRKLIDDLTTLEDYDKINFNQTQRVRRIPPPTIITEDDTHVSSINTKFDFPYAVFTTNDNRNIKVIDIEPMNVWSHKTRNITITSEGGTRIIVPKEVTNYVKRELYDYPYINSNSKLVKSNPMDIIFFSNGEASADFNYERLVKLTKRLPNKVTRIDRINGRVKSQHAAANASDTSWYFLVNAKLHVDSSFDFNWQPDRLQIPKHYIFHATNPVNGLVYGHQAIVANNKKLTLENFGTGLDFTMDSEHEVVSINSGTSMYNRSEWDAWRTSFRECIKLKASETEENTIRLNTWLTIGMGEFSQYSLQGAKDAVEYYNEVAGDLPKLKLSYDWLWLQAKFNDKYNFIKITKQ